MQHIALTAALLMGLTLGSAPRPSAPPAERPSPPPVPSEHAAPIPAPPNPDAPTPDTQISISVKFAGHINPSDYYFVVFNTSTDKIGADGPVPVIAPPWGNGFVAGAATHYLRYSSTQPGDGYLLYAFASGSSLQQSTVLGAPSDDASINAASSTLQFRIPLSQLATTDVPLDKIVSLQINVIATDRLPVNPEDSAPKEFDALGDPTKGQLNSYITIPVNRSGIYNNANGFVHEAAGDVQKTNGSGGYTKVDNPDIDIVDYSIQVLR